MISETRFAKSYSSLWRELTPTLELFVRKANLRLAERSSNPLISTSPPGRRALINQVAFQAVRDAANQFETHFDRREWVLNYENIVLAERTLTGAATLNNMDLVETSQLASRMCANLFLDQPHKVTVNPSFRGCGFVNSCFGDGLSTSHRFIELKDGDRPFRAYEFRQLLIYAALHLNGGGEIASEFQVINSRRGLSVTVSLDEFAREVAGQSPYDLLTEVVRSMSDSTMYQS